MDAGSFPRVADGDITTGTVLTAAVLSSLLLFSSVFQLLRHKAWFFSSFSAALLLESGGFAALGYLTTHVTNHVAYLVSFSTLTLGPALLVLATISAFGRLVKSNAQYAQARGICTLWLPGSLIAPLCMTVQSVAVVFFAYGISGVSALHSSTPIQGTEDAYKRLAFEAQAITMLSAGYIVQLICLGLFMIASSGALANNGSSVDYQRERISWAVQSVAIFSLARTGVKVATYASLDPQSLDILGGGTTAWLLDVVPLIGAFVIFTRCYPTITTQRIFLEPAQEAGFEKTLLIDYEDATTC